MTTDHQDPEWRPINTMPRNVYVRLLMNNGTTKIDYYVDDELVHYDGLPEVHPIAWQPLQRETPAP